MPDKCSNYKKLLFRPGKNVNRPTIRPRLEKTIWSEARHSCSIPSCRKYGLEIHHIVPWRDALAKFGKPHYEKNLIALCHACHAAADDGQITRHELREAKEQLGKVVPFPENVLFEITSLNQDVRAAFLDNLHDLHRYFIYTGKYRQYEDYLSQVYKGLEKKKLLNSIESVAVLSSFGNLLRRKGSKQFPEAERLLSKAVGISSSLQKSTSICPFTGRLKYDLAYISFLKNDFVRAKSLFDESVCCERVMGNSVGQHISKSLVHVIKNRQTGNYSKDAIEANLNVFLEKDNPDSQRWSTNCYVHLADIEIHNNNFEEALGHLQTATDRYDRSSIQTGRAKLLRLEGISLLNLGLYEEAAWTFSASLSHHNNFRVREGVAEAFFHYGRSLEEMGEIERAKESYAKGTSTDEQMDNKTGIKLCERRLKNL